MSGFITAVLLLGVALPRCLGYPEGAPVEACEDMRPQHVVPPQNSAPNYGISATDNGDGTFTVVLERTNDNEFENFRGFLIQARSASTGTLALGEFFFEEGGLVQGRPCPAEAGNNGVTHVNAVDLKSSIEVTWSAGEDADTPEIYFVATVVLNFSTFWVEIQSDFIN